MILVSREGKRAKEQKQLQPMLSELQE